MHVGVTEKNLSHSELVDNWNALPAHVVEAETVRKLETELDKYMGDEMFDF